MMAAPFKPQRGRLDARLSPDIGLPRTLWYQIEIPLEPFVFDGDTQQTSVHVGDIGLPVRSWRQLPGREFRFPVNPEPGYIDGSVYLAEAHHPAHATRIAFGELRGSVLTAIIDITFDFTFEGGVPEFGVFSVNWPVELDCDPLALDAMTREADRTAAPR